MGSVLQLADEWREPESGDGEEGTEPRTDSNHQRGRDGEGAQGMKSGKAEGSDEIPAEVWKCLGWFGVVTLCKLFKSIIITETVPSAWRDSVLVPIFKEKGDIQECQNYRWIKLLTHTFKIWERVLDRRVRECTDIHESQVGFMPGRSTTDAIFILKQTIDKSRGTEGHLSNLHRPREGLRPSPEGGDLDNHEGEAGTRKICQAGPIHVHWMPNEGARSRGRKQQIQC